MGAASGEMELRRFGSTGLAVSELCLGGLTLGREADETTSRTIIDRFFECGGNFIDTADIYANGESEAMLGKLLKDRRDRVVVATKTGLPDGEPGLGSGSSRRRLMLAIDASLRRLQTDWIDLYQLHSWDPHAPLDETLATLNDAVRAGKVRYVGVSNFAAWHVAKGLGISHARGWHAISSVQPSYSLLHRDAEVELLPMCRDEGLALLPYSPLGGGVLTGKYSLSAVASSDTRAGSAYSAYISRDLNARNLAIADAVGRVAEEIGRSRAQVALNWVMHRGGVTSPIIGARNVAQLDDNLGAVGWSLDAEHVSALDAVSEPTYWHPHDTHLKLGITVPFSGPKAGAAIDGWDWSKV